MEPENEELYMSRSQPVVEVSSTEKHISVWTFSKRKKPSTVHVTKVARITQSFRVCVTRTSLSRCGSKRKRYDKLSWMDNINNKQRRRPTSTEFQGEHQGQEPSAPICTICCWRQSGLQGRRAQKTKSSTSEVGLHQIHTGTAQNIWNNIFWTGETTLELLGSHHSSVFTRLCPLAKTDKSKPEAAGIFCHLSKAKSSSFSAI